jgi:hypothetical protein
MRLAKLRVKDQLRANNLRIKDYEYAELTQLAWLWFSEHRAELLGYATIELLFASHNSKHLHRNRSADFTALSLCKSLERIGVLE